ncbi:MAG: DUF669 domain-containing protein [Lentisphaeria bacterium]
MEKPQGYDNVQAKSFGEYETLEPGGYICKIIKAEEQKSKSGKSMLVLFYDISEGEHAGYFRRVFDRMKEKNADAKWKGTYYQLTEGNSTEYFKGLITSIQESNNGFKFNFDEKALKGKLFGGAFGLEEWAGNGKTGMEPVLRFVCSVDSVKKGINPPKDKLLDKSSSVLDGFNLMDDDDDLPFI